MLMWDSKIADSKSLTEAQTIYYVPSSAKSTNEILKGSKNLILFHSSFSNASCVALCVAHIMPT